MPKRILIVDDEEKIRIMFNKYLTKQGYEVIAASNGDEALKIFFDEGNIDLVLLDLMMPVKDGYETCKELKQNSDVPVIILTAKDTEEDEIAGLDCGADEYLSKLSSLKLINKRIELILRRFSQEESEILKAGDIELNLTTHEFKIDNEVREVSLKEFELLTFFIRNQGKALTRENILKNVWNYNYFEDSRTLDTHIKKLRKSIGRDKDYIKTIWGVGYKFEVSDETVA